MKTKLEMAHDYAVAMLKTPAQLTGLSDKDIAIAAFNLAEAMQAEADKRLAEAEYKEEWQPDWSQAPDGYDWFAVDKKGTAYFYTYKPETIESDEYWADFTGISSNGTALESDSSFGYTGDWRESLRKRPN